MITEHNLESENIELNFNGPYKFTRDNGYLFDSEHSAKEGIYIWTILDEVNNCRYVHYIGETTSFSRRQKEHLLQVTGLNYRIIDAELARQGIESIVWNGLWRDKSSNAVALLLDNYEGVSKKVIEYIRIIDIYFAPTNLEAAIRRHVEGSIGWHLRNNYPHFKTFYPDDNHVGVKAKKLGRQLIIRTPSEIVGIDNTLSV